MTELKRDGARIWVLLERAGGEESMPQMQTTIGFFKKAIEIDPS
jgi:hypothetical protein